MVEQKDEKDRERKCLILFFLTTPIRERERVFLIFEV